MGITMGQQLLAAGQPGQARQVLAASHAAAARLGWTDLIRRIGELLSAATAQEEK